MNTVNAFRPSQVVLGTPPLTSCFEKTESEVAAALLVWSLTKNGDAFAPLSRKAMSASLDEGLAAREEPLVAWAGNPFLHPDFQRLARDGYIEILKSPNGDFQLAFTAKGIARLTRWVLGTEECVLKVTVS